MSLTPTLLLILDGYGLAPAGPGNAASLARTPNIDRLISLPGATRIDASGRAVGLPAGYMGNSEVGHLNIGAGRIVYQDMTRIDVAMETGELASNAALLELLANVKRTGGRLHFAGLLSDGGVHSHINHLGALMDIAAAHGVDVRVHAFMDGRDTSPTSGAGFLAQLGDMMARTRAVHSGVSVEQASLVGRFYAMDRDKRWERVKVAWDMMVHGEGRRASDPVAAVEALYAAGETDEFLKPQVLGDPADVCVRNGDGIFFINFRADRGRELVSSFHFPDFDGFDRGGVPALAGLVTMTSYDSSLHVPVAFPKENLVQTLGEVVADAGAHQLRIAETEKYAHVTYFFSGGREEPFPLEDRILVNSPKDVATYDLKPQMSVLEVTDRFLEAWAAGPEKDGVPYTLAVCNLANPDMVGHTGIIEAAVKALEYVDGCVARLVEVVLSSGGRVLMTADHGNVEVMLDETGHPQTAHPCNQVPLVVVERGADGERAVPLRPGGKLGDIAPTLLDLWGLAKPGVMSGESLVEGVRG